MQTKHQAAFITIRTEGAILPPDLLQRVADGDASLDGMTSDSYHLASGIKLNEAINRSWTWMLGRWQSFKESKAKLPEGDRGTTVTRERLLLPLFQELGYGRLTVSKAFEIEGKTYPISHLWQNNPIHLIGYGVDIDKMNKGVAGSAKINPHGMVQEFLNRSEAHLWAFVSNGKTLRILRDNLRLTRQAYVEFDLESMFEGEIYADFVLLWLLCHQSRVEAEKPEECWLEKWSKVAQDQGTRALDHLREGVESAIRSLGSGFLKHPANGELREKLRSGTLNKQDYYRQLLRMVYRLILLFVAEDRELLFDPHSAAEARKAYLEHYSLTRLRTMAGRIRGGRHHDLYQMLKLITQKLGGDHGCPELGLPALNGFLFSAEALPDLELAELANADLLEAIRCLSTINDGVALRSVDYRNLGAEELGSIYESLLELHPDLNLDAGTFELKTAGGNERKTTGSYYTPSSLIQCLLDSALEPVLVEALKQPNPEDALLSLKVCDPACGSGHFLIAAAHRIARKLAIVRTGDDEPAPPEIRHALRDVISHCIYGVDINPMSVELCKVSLWMEALEPGKPLSFLDHKIQCGNSLLGVTPRLLKNGIPDDAFHPIEGDDRAVCSGYKKENSIEKKQRSFLMSTADFQLDLGNLATTLMKLESIEGNSVDEIRKKHQLYHEYIDSSDYRFGHLLADAWCAAFVWEKTEDNPNPPITEDIFRRIEKNPWDLHLGTKNEIERLSQLYQFFHWQLTFPDIFRIPFKDEKPDNEQTGWCGGFDVVLGNPPWERIKLQEKEWFAERNTDIANAPNASRRRKMIDSLSETDPTLYQAFLEDCRKAEGESHFIRDSNTYPLCGRGDVNTYTIFAEMNRNLLSPMGRFGCIVPSGIATDDTTKFFFQDLMEKHSLSSLYDFENREKLFPDVDSRMKFCLLTLTGLKRPATQGADFVFFAQKVEDLHEDNRHFSLTAEEIALLNPNTRTCPIFRSKRDAELTKGIYRRVPVLIKETYNSKGQVTHTENPWGVKFSTMFHMTNDSGLFRTKEQLESDGWILKGNVFEKREHKYLPLYEGRMIHHFDHRVASMGTNECNTFRSGVTLETSSENHMDSEYAVMPRYWVFHGDVYQKLHQEFNQNALIVFKDVTSSTNERTFIGGIIPFSAIGNTLPIMLVPKTNYSMSALLISNLTAFSFDSIAKFKIGGNHTNFFLINQLPVIMYSVYSQNTLWSHPSQLSQWISSRAIELIFTAWDLEPFAKDCGYTYPPFKWNEERRHLIRCELDAAYFHLYSIERDDVDYIMGTFPIVKRKDEQKYGEYRTKAIILHCYDKMAEAIKTGEPYQTILDPPPADPSLCHPPREEVR
ncbi:N-6 DNA methylase [Deltaproteobacteria bacterium TL4]